MKGKQKRRYLARLWTPPRCIHMMIILAAGREEEKKRKRERKLTLGFGLGCGQDREKLL